MRIFLCAIIFLTIGHIQEAKASALAGPSCFIEAEVVNIGSEKRRLDSGKDYESFYIDLKVIEVYQGKFPCPVVKNQVYRIIDNYPGVFKIGDIIRAGVEAASSMGPNGPVNFLHWSDVTYRNGSPIIYKNNIRIDYLQSFDEPVNRN